MLLNDEEYLLRDLKKAFEKYETNVIFCKKFPVFLLKNKWKFSYREPKSELSFYILELGTLLDNKIDFDSIQAFFGLPEILAKNIVLFMIKNDLIIPLSNNNGLLPFKKLKQAYETKSSAQREFYLFKMDSVSSENAVYQITEKGIQFLKSGIPEEIFEREEIMYFIPDLECFISRFYSNNISNDKEHISEKGQQNFYREKIYNFFNNLEKKIKTGKNLKQVLTKHGLPENFRGNSDHSPEINSYFIGFIWVYAIPIYYDNRFTNFRLEIRNRVLPQNANLIEKELLELIDIIENSKLISITEDKLKLNGVETVKVYQKDSFLEIKVKLENREIKNFLSSLVEEFYIDLTGQSNNTFLENEDSHLLIFEFNEGWKTVTKVKFVPATENDAKLLCLINIIRDITKNDCDHIDYNETINKNYTSLINKCNLHFEKPCLDEVEDFLWELKKYGALHKIYEWRYIIDN